MFDLKTYQKRSNDVLVSGEQATKPTGPFYLGSSAGSRWHSPGMPSTSAPRMRPSTPGQTTGRLEPVGAVSHASVCACFAWLIPSRFTDKSP